MAAKRTGRNHVHSGPLAHVNYYETAAVKRFTKERFTWPNQASMQLFPDGGLPRIGWIGSSGSGKTNSCFEMLFKHMACWDAVYVVSKDLEEALYKALIDRPQDFSPNPRQPMEVYATDSLEEWEQLFPEADREQVKVVILDDQLGEKMDRHKAVLQVFNRGRKLNFASVFINSSFFDIDSKIRKNLSYIGLKHLDVQKDAKAILSYYGLPAAVFDLYEQITQNEEDWMLLDLTTAAKRNPLLAVRKNYLPIALMPVKVKRAPRERPEADDEEGDEEDE
jgi:hypothetical protein